MSLSPPVSLALGLAVALAGGWLFSALGVPLAWILGAMAGSTLFANTVGVAAGTRNVRRTGQLLVGAATAGVLTPDTLMAVAGLFPAMIASAIAANLFGLLLAWPLAAIAGTDRLTALLASLPAGMAEMSSLAKDVGAQAEIVTLVHTLRVILVVAIIPFLLAIPPQTGVGLIAPAQGSYLALGACVGLGLALAVLAARIGLINPFVVMPMLLGAAMVAAGISVARMPAPLLIAAQVLIGFSLGTRLRKEDFSRMPRTALAGLVCGGLLIGCMAFIVAPLLSAWSGLDGATAALGAAPGGLGEMIASAKALGVSSAIVAGFQFVRSFLTNIIIPQLIIRMSKVPAAGESPK